MCLQVTRNHNFKVFVFNILFGSVEAYDQWFHIYFYQKALDHDTQKRKPRPDENFSTTKCTARVNCREKEENMRSTCSFWNLREDEWVVIVKQSNSMNLKRSLKNRLQMNMKDSRNSDCDKNEISKHCWEQKKGSEED